MKTYEQLSNAVMNGGEGGVCPVVAAPSRRAASAKSPRPPPLCRFFFQSGYCRNGDACRFSHDPRGMTREEALKTIPCPYHAAGSCRYGERCMLRHGDDECDDAVCGICLEVVASSRRQFGLLSCCDHAFCYGCLMEWRKEGSSDVASRRVCPTCRKTSDYVVPSSVRPGSAAEKEEILRSYKANLSVVPCKHFEAGKLGSCPFGRDCFYAHLDRRGRDIKSRDRSMQQLYDERQRQRNNRDRDINYIAEMILMMGLQRHLNRQARRGSGRRYGGEESDSDDEDGSDDDVDIFLSDIMAALMD